MAASNLTLVLPSPCLSESELEELPVGLKKAGDSLSHLRKIFSAGDKEDVLCQKITLSQLFGFNVTESDDIPVGAIQAHGGGVTASSGYWMCAEPVHLRPDLDHVLLFDRSHLEITRKDLQQFVDELKELIGSAGLDIYLSLDSSIYIRSDYKPKVKFVPLNEVVEKNILPSLPEGVEGAKWRLLLNEIQMQMTQSKVNTNRGYIGQPEINGLWLWGGGTLPKKLFSSVTHVVSSNPFVKGLAHCVNIPMSLSVSSYSDLPDEEHSLICFDSLADYQGRGKVDMYVNRLQDVEKEWFIPALDALKNKTLESLVLITGRQKLELRRKDRVRFWTRKISVTALANGL
ncbi:MAG: hypothetical protein KAT25_07055 [Sulfuriflexus sp.]|nr:hypothetical protein [Sulfuriflexus sp.]